LTEDTYDKSVKALSLRLGHASLATSLYSYIHSFSTVPHQGDIIDFDKEFSAKALACLLGEPYNTYRKRKLDNNQSIEWAISASKLKPFDSD
jgi:hypothetical protein